MNVLRARETKMPGILICYWWILFLMLACLNFGTATITLTSSLDGQPATPGEMVNYTCTVTEAVSVSWTATPNLTDATFARFFANSPDLRMVACSDASSPVQCATLDFQASLTSVGDVTSGTANMTSMFRLTATAALNETVVQCRSSTLTVPETASETLIVETPAPTTVTTVMTPTTVRETALPTSSGTRVYESLWAVVLAMFGVLALVQDE